jgi:hypothetical protein
MILGVLRWASACFFACCFEVETLGLTGFLNAGRSHQCRGREMARRVEGDGASSTAGDQNPFDSPAQE